MEVTPLEQEVNMVEDDEKCDETDDDYSLTLRTRLIMIIFSRCLPVQKYEVT